MAKCNPMKASGTTDFVISRGLGVQFVSVENDPILTYFLMQFTRRYKGRRLRVLKHNNSKRFTITSIMVFDGRLGFLAPASETFVNEPITLEIEVPQPLLEPEPVLALT